MAMTFVVVLCAMGSGLGLTGLVRALKSPSPTREGDGATSVHRSLASSGWWQSRFGPEADARGGMVKLGMALVGGVVVLILTDWPVAAVLGAVATVTLPQILRPMSSQDVTRRIEAVAVWTELLRDTLTASAGLAQAIVASSAVAPDEIRMEAVHLADRIMSGVPMDEALRLFAIEIDDSSAADVVCALRLASTSRAQRLVELLGALADSTREEVTMRLRVEASRASARSSVRIVIVFSLGFVALLTVVARTYLAPFGSVTGQLVLLLVGACYVCGLALMVRLVRPAPRNRGRGLSPGVLRT
jgi:tight adherence protein B